RIAKVANAMIIGRFITNEANLLHCAGPSLFFLNIIARLILLPINDNNAGKNVKEDRTEMKTTAIPPMATERKISTSNTSIPDKPSATQKPEKAIERPAVFVVLETAVLIS